MTEFADLIAAGKEFGVFQIFLPLLLVFTVIYAVLAKINIFGAGKKGNSINLVVSAIISFLVIGYTAPGVAFAEYIGTAFTGTVLVVVTLLGSIMIVYVLAKVIGIDIPPTNITGKKGWGVLLLLIVLLLALGVFVSSGGKAFFPGLVLPGVTIPEIPIPVLPSINFTTAHLALLLMVGGLAAVAWYLSKQPAG